MRVFFFAAFSLAAALLGTARAQTYSEEHLALAREVVALSDAEGAMGEMLDLMAPEMANQIVASGASREFATRYVELFREEFRADAPRMAEMLSVAYAGAFTLQELRDVRDFYASPSGRSLVAKTGEINQAMSRVGMLLGEEVGQRALARMEAERGRRPENP
jgi:hypothetical protein